MQIGELIKDATARLQGVTGTPRQDAQAILAHVIGKAREYLIAHSEQPVSEIDQQTFAKLLRLRQQGMPLAYIIGQRAFYDRVFRINPQVLIPRPETEHLVEAALEWAKDRGPLRIVDVGTGSGIIAVTLAAHLPQSQVIAADVSAAAVALAYTNADGLTNISFVQSDLLAALCGPFDVICANLPYIASADMSILDVAKFEPHVALDGGNDGLFLIRRLLEQAPTRLKQPGLMLLEIGADQGEAAAALARSTFPDVAVSVIKDLAKLDRVVRIEW